MSESLRIPSVLKFRSVDAREFIIARSKLDAKISIFLTLHNEIGYSNQGTNLFLSKDGLSGYGINPDGELISVFSVKRQRGPYIVKSAVMDGAQYLYCIGDKLKVLYSMSGFLVNSVLAWDDSLAPENWDYTKFGRPKIYKMKLSEFSTQKLIHKNDPRKNLMDLLRAKKKSSL